MTLLPPAYHTWNFLFPAELREAFKLHDYDMDGKIFAADVGACIRSVPGLKPSQHEIEEIKSYMERGGEWGGRVGGWV